MCGKGSCDNIASKFSRYRFSNKSSKMHKHLSVFLIFNFKVPLLKDMADMLGSVSVASAFLSR